MAAGATKDENDRWMQGRLFVSLFPYARSGLTGKNVIFGETIR